MKKWLLSVAWVLLGLLAVSAFVISTGNRSAQVSPTVSSYAPSGTSALADFLRMRGYQVVVDGHAKPKLQKGDVAIAFQFMTEENSVFGQSDSESTALQDTENSIEGQLKGGGLVFWLPIGRDFEAASGGAQYSAAYTRIDGKSRTLSGDSSKIDADSDSSVNLLSDKDNAFITGDRLGDHGYAVTYSDGIGLTNRFLDKANNAQTFAELLKTYAPDSHRIVFTEATFGKVTTVGFLETLGPWAEGSWYQFLFVLGVIVFTWNQRFGLPIRRRKVQAGGRELVDALTDTMVRAKATSMSLDSAYNRADARIRKVVKLPRDASEGERDRTLPENILQRLKEVKVASTMDKVRPREALTLVVKLEAAVNEFTAANSSVQTKPRRRKKTA